MSDTPDASTNDSVKLEDKSVKDLQADLVALGMPEEDTRGFTTKAPLIATINALKAKTVVDKVASINETANPGEERQVNKKWLTKAQKMRDVLDKQPKIRFFIPLEPKEKHGVVRRVMINGREEIEHVSGAIETVTLNGCKTIIPKGVYWDIPKQVADVLSESLIATQNAGKDILADRFDPNTGKPIRDQLS